LAARLSPPAVGWTRRLALGAAAALALAGCAEARTAIPVQRYRVVASYPHDPGAFTQGLFVKDGLFYESTGLYGRSSIRKVKPETGQVLMSVALPRQVFGEGLTWWDKRLINITWTTGVGFTLDLDSFRQLGSFRYAGEGWGLTRSDRHIVMSDGTAELRLLDPATLAEVGRIKVTADGRPVTQLNELEWVKGEVWANIWQTDRIARIDPKTGRVKAWIDLRGLLDRSRPEAAGADVLNGIAYDAATDRLFVTGKLWPKVFEIKVR
jgi:glutaminyl-peptide cyclotransferase